jgi:hypothetical protein
LIESRIIPTGQELSKFEQGQAQIKNANRRITRGMRKLNKCYKQRRNKLIYVLQQLDMLLEQTKLSEPFTNLLKLDRVSILPIDKKQKQCTAPDLLELRVKALSEPVSLKELGKIIYLFNQFPLKTVYPVAGDNTLVPYFQNVTFTHFSVNRSCIILTGDYD